MSAVTPLLSRAPFEYVTRFSIHSLYKEHNFPVPTFLVCHRGSVGLLFPNAHSKGLMLILTFMLFLDSEESDYTVKSCLKAAADMQFSTFW